MRYLRQHSSLNIREMDEEVMKANNDIWPDDNAYKDQVLVPKVLQEILQMKGVIYLTSYVPEELLKEARNHDFKIVLLDISLEELQRRNQERMKVEGYADATPWLQLQLDTFARLSKDGLIDVIVEGENLAPVIAEELLSL